MNKVVGFAAGQVAEHDLATLQRAMTERVPLCALTFSKMYGPRFAAIVNGDSMTPRNLQMAIESFEEANAMMLEVGSRPRSEALRMLRGSPERRRVHPKPAIDGRCPGASPFLHGLSALAGSSSAENLPIGEKITEKSRMPTVSLLQLTNALVFLGGFVESAHFAQKLGAVGGGDSHRGVLFQGDRPVLQCAFALAQIAAD